MRPRDPDREVSRVLRLGLYVSSTLLVLGWTGHLLDPRPIGAFGVDVLSAHHGWAAALLWWGLTVLVLTPIARIVTTVIAYGRQRPPFRVFALLALGSLAVIGVGVLLGKAPA